MKFAGDQVQYFLDRHLESLLIRFLPRKHVGKRISLASESATMLVLLYLCKFLAIVHVL